MANRTHSTDEANREVKAAAEEAAADLRDGARRLADQARQTIDDAVHGDSAQRLKQAGADAVEAARETGRDYAGRAKHEAERLYDEGRRRADEVATHAEDYYDELSDLVRRKPAQALGIAAGIGFLVGLILARR